MPKARKSGRAAASKKKFSPLSAALERNSAAIALMVLGSFILAAVGTAYYGLAFSRSQFDNLPEVKQYDNLLTGVTGQDEWSRTQFYWANNLSVAGRFAVMLPIYFGPNSCLINGYGLGLALVYHYNNYGPEAALAFAGLIFVHGILEMTAVFIIGGASLRLAWKLWGYLGGALKGGFGKMTKRRKAAAESYLKDYVMMFALGALMIFLAAPIEAYISPFAGGMFLSLPALGLVYLGLVAIAYAAIARRGLPALQRVITSGMKGARSLLSRKWWPDILPLLLLVIFSLMIWLLAF